MPRTVTDLTDGKGVRLPEAPSASPRRLCPACGQSDEIADRAALWPPEWRCRACGFAPSVQDDFVRLAPELDEVDEGFALQSYEALNNIEEGHFWFATRNELIGWLVRRHATGAKRALEIGCGTGFVLFALRKALPAVRIAGSELHSRGLKYARHRHGHQVELLQMDARRSGLVEAIDLVGAFDVLEHIPDDQGVLAEIHRMLKPGGRLIATVPQHPWLWSASDEIAHHQRRYRTGELAAKARNAGFRILYQSSFATFALPLMVASRMRLRPSDDNASAADSLNVETRVPRPLNAALRIVFRAEHVLRRLGLPLPFGGSRVLVAEKPAVFSA